MVENLCGEGDYRKEVHETKKFGKVIVKTGKKPSEIKSADGIQIEKGWEDIKAFVPEISKPNDEAGQLEFNIL